MGENFVFNETLFIGGTKDSSKISKKFKMTKGLKGAMQKVKKLIQFYHYIYKHQLLTSNNLK